MMNARMSFLHFIETIASLRLTYFKEQIRQSPVLSAVSGLFVLLILLQAGLIVSQAFVPVPKEMEAQLAESIGKIKIGVITIIPLLLLLKQIFFPSFLIDRSNTGFFRLFPIPSEYIILMRLIEGGLAATEIVMMSGLFLVLTYETQDFALSSLYLMGWWLVIRAVVGLWYELYCLVSNYTWFLILLYIFIVFWIMSDFMDTKLPFPMPKLSSFWKGVDMAFFSQGWLGMFLLLAALPGMVVLCSWIFEFKMKKLGLVG
jgi:hypothetical protein